MTQFTQQDIINAQTNAKIEILAQEMKDFKDEMRDFKNEMRDRDNQRASEISEMRQAFQSLHNQNIVVIIGVIAIAVAVFLK